MLIESEWDERTNRKHDRSVKNAHFRYKAMVEQISFAGTRSVHKNQILRLADCVFIDKKENILITGSTGIGKSYIASAIGHQACSLGYRVLYEHSAKLFARLKMAKADGSYLKELVKMEKQNLLIIDDFGMQPLDAQSRAILMEIIEDRHGKRSALFTVTSAGGAMVRSDRRTNHCRCYLRPHHSRRSQAGAQRRITQKTSRHTTHRKHSNNTLIF
ncbi:hypothetical protein BH10BAC6_BH10BAC6_14220 [soil metagenome]